MIRHYDAIIAGASLAGLARPAEGIRPALYFGERYGGPVAAWARRVQRLWWRRDATFGQLDRSAAPWLPARGRTS